MSITPFTLVETSPGKFSLLLSTFSPADQIFDAAGMEGGGYSWEGIARFVIEEDEIQNVGLDPEGSMFCAYGEDRATLETLGERLASLFHDHTALAEAIATIGPEGFDD
ncbi:MAG: Imm51 family immunity protein [Kofleriaceae bacterium]